MSKTAIVILNYNGKHFLEKFLPSVLQYSQGHSVYVADNASNDHSVEFLKSRFPEVNIIELKENFGYAGGYNQALKQIQADYFVLLNSDIEVTENWLDTIIGKMEENPNIGAVQPKY